MKEKQSVSLHRCFCFFKIWSLLSQKY